MLKNNLKKRIQLYSDFNEDLCTESHENNNIPEELILNPTEMRDFCNFYNKSRTKRLFELERKFRDETDKNLKEIGKEEGYVPFDTASKVWTKYRKIEYKVTEASYSEFGTPFYNGII